MCGGRSWAGPERGSEILCVLTLGMGSTPPPPISMHRDGQNFYFSEFSLMITGGEIVEDDNVVSVRCLGFSILFSGKR